MRAMTWAALCLLVAYVGSPWVKYMESGLDLLGQAIPGHYAH